MDVRSDCSETLLGTCQAMCSSAEHQERQQQRRLSVFETPSSSHKNLPVKEYSRCAAGKQTSLSELRPEGVLVKTMNYLIDEIVDRTDHPWSTVYHFVFDRIRAIRQDLVIQRIANESTVEILEKAVRMSEKKELVDIDFPLSLELI
ncbi:Germinal-center associated nuclear protein [Exaiptasia diaphana]|nr:Germinal-center associated nuclear protein [Exaiptasia diaphana]